MLMNSLRGMPEKNDGADRYVRQVLSAYLKNRPMRDNPACATDWERIGHTVMVHGLEGVFQHALNEIDVPSQMRDAWQKRTMAVLFENIRSLRTAVRLFHLLDENKIPAVAMRGLTLANKDYESPGMRSMGDIDVLISPEDRKRLLDVAQRAGYSPEKVLRSQYVFKIEGGVIELHWSFLTAKRYRDQLESRFLLATRQPFTTPDGGIYCLSNENELIGLVAHSFIHHDLSVLNQLLDIAIYMMKPAMDWDYIKRWCEATNLSRMFALTLDLVSRFFMLEVEGFRRAFGNMASPRLAKTLPDYTAPFFGKTGIGSYIRRKGNLLYIAEHPRGKLNQLLCFCTVKEAKELFRRLFQGRAGHDPRPSPGNKA